MRYRIFLAGVVLFVIITVPSISFAYIDPGTGSYMLQIIIAGVFGALFTFKVFFNKIKRLFTGKRKDTDLNADDKTGNE